MGTVKPESNAPKPDRWAGTARGTLQEGTVKWQICGDISVDQITGEVTFRGRLCGKQQNQTPNGDIFPHVELRSEENDGRPRRPAKARRRRVATK